MNDPVLLMHAPSPSAFPTVYWLDADPQRDKLDPALCQVVHCSHPDQFFAEFNAAQANCVILADQLPCMNGLEVLQRIRQLGSRVPLVVVLDQACTRLTVAYMRAGALSVLERPIDSQELIDSVRSALELDRAQRTQTQRRAGLFNKIPKLTPRESQVLRLVLDGAKSKQIAQQLAIAAKTVDVHRSNIVRKLEIESFSELIYELLNDNGTDNARAKKTLDELLAQQLQASAVMPTTPHRPASAEARRELTFTEPLEPS